MCVKTNMDKICRICLSQSKDSIHLFEHKKQSKEILDKIYSCFRIELNPGNDLPNTICAECVAELNAANNFRIKCTSLDERIAIFNKLSSSTALEQKSTYGETDSLTNLDEEACLDEVTVGAHVKENINKIESFGSVFQCNMCDKALKTNKSLSKHMIVMHINRKHIGKITGFGASRCYHCTSCSYSTPHSQTLVNHMRKHDGKRPYQCNCGKHFTQSSSLAAHLKTHSDTTYFTCTICGKQFKHAYTLKKHFKVHENGNFVCDICHKILKSKQSLQDHRHRHFNIRNFNCEACGDTFVTSSELISHRKIHNIDKQLQCYLCEYKTHTKKSLILHLKRQVL